MTVVYANKFTLQVSDTVRLIYQDERPVINHFERPTAGNAICITVGELVVSPANARALRDLLVQYVNDDVTPGAMN